MIKVNGTPITLQKFFDNSYKIVVPEISTLIQWNYQSDEELFQLIAVTQHLKDNGINPSLFMPYIPNARMDRTQNFNECFTLKAFAHIINSLDFVRVFVFDPHSFVSLALLDRVVEIPVKPYLEKAISLTNAEVLCYPDFGAFKRYHAFDTFGLPEVYGKKIRDWNTREITRYDITSDSNQDVSSLLSGKRVLIIDDIISTGGTMALASKELIKSGASVISLYCSHLESEIFKPDSTLGDMYLSGKINQIISTDSLNSYRYSEVITLNVTP